MSEQTKSHASWRGAARSAKTALHEWQNVPSVGQRIRPKRMVAIRAGAAILLALGLLSVWTYLLLKSPAKTPLIVIAPRDYEWPLPPNAWAAESIQGMQELDTIHLIDISNDWENRPKRRSLDALANALSALGEAGRRKSESVIVYVKMYGAVNEKGESCLLPPGVPVHDSSKWMTVKELIDRIVKSSEDVDRLLVLDYCQDRVNWNMGMLDNTFAEGLENSHPEPSKSPATSKLVVLNSTSPWQKSWASTGSSVFGHYFQLGLAGNADGWADGSGRGPRNRQVSTGELATYLKQHVNAWTVHHCGDRQEPMSVPGVSSKEQDFDVALAMSKRALEQQFPALQRPSLVGGPASVPQQEMDALWNRLEKLRDAPDQPPPYRFDPVAWRDLEHQMLWLEELATSGGAYADRAERVRSDLEHSLNRIENQKQVAQRQAGIYPWWQVFAEYVPQPREAFGHTLPMAEYFGAIDVAKAGKNREVLLTFAESPSPSGLDEALNTLPDTPSLAEVHFLRLLARYSHPDLWQQPEVLRRALAVRTTAERIAAPTEASRFDERVHFLTEKLVGEADRWRRTAEDRLFAASRDEDFELVRSDWDEAQKHYDSAETLTSTVSAALDLRDRVWAEVPYWAQWLTRAPLTASAHDAEPAKQEHQPRELAGAEPAVDAHAVIDDGVNHRLLPLIRENLALDKLLMSRPHEGGDVDLPAIAQQARKVEGFFEGLRQELHAECERLKNLPVESTIVAAADWRSLGDVLRIPFLKTEIRTSLRDQFAEIGGKLSKSFELQETKTRSKPGLDAEPMAPRDGYAKRMFERWQEHPALLILGVAKRAGVEAGDARDDMRMRLARMGADMRSHLAKLREQAGSEPTAERDLRAAAPFWFDKPKAKQDAVVLRRQDDLRHLLLWQCRRALDDFWGPASESKDASNYFFNSAVSGYLAAIRAMPGDPLRDATAELAEIEKVRVERIELAQDGLHVAVNDPLFIEELNTPGLKPTVRVEQRDQAAFPAGLAALFLREPVTRNRLPRRGQMVPLSLKEKVLAAWQPVDDALFRQVGRGDERGEISWQAVAMFRAHEFTRPLVLRPLGGFTVDHQPVDHPTAKLTLSAPAIRKPLSVVFVLDCSQSMNEPVSVEEARGSAVATRHDVAKAALGKMLELLADSEQARVGVRLFGHRVGWRPNEPPDEVLRQLDYDSKRPIPEGLLPSVDVERVLPVGRFDRHVLDLEVAGVLEAVRPWGESPLYLAIIRAIEDLVFEEPKTQKAVIVISDGRNNQFNPPDPKRASDVPTQIPIHVVWTDTSVSEELANLQRTTGGQFVVASEGTSLIRFLETPPGPGRYQVLDKAGKAIRAAEVNSRMAIAAPFQGRVVFKPFIGGPAIAEDVELKGGEDLRLWLRPDGDRIESAAYLEDNPRFVPFLGAEERKRLGAGLRAGLHKPIAGANGVRFPISFQRPDRRIVKRPVEVWLEVTPVSSDGQPIGDPYVFWDVQYEPEKPVPLWIPFALNWPPTATRASVQLWCKDKATRPTSTVELRQVAASGASDQPFEVDGIPGVTFAALNRADEKPPHVRIVVRHAESGPGVEMLRVEMAPRPRRIERRIDAQNRITSHVFEFESIDKLDQRYKIHFTSRDALREGAMELENPVVLDIPATADVIPSVSLRE